MVATEDELLTGQLARTRRFLRILFECTELSNRTDTADAFIEQTLDLICREMDRPLGCAWCVDESSDELRFSCHVNPGRVPAANFVSKCAEIRFSKGVGLPGRAFAEGKAIWISDLAADANFPRLPLAKSAGLKSGFAFLVRSDRSPIAVLEFFSADLHPVEDETVEFLSQLGAYIGLVVERKNAQQRLAHRERVLNAIIDNTTECVFLIDGNGKCLLANDAALDLIGGSLDNLPEDVRGTRTFKIDTTTPFKQEELPVVIALNGGECTDVELYFEPNPGLGRWLSVTARPMQEPDGTVTGAILFCRNITSQRRMQEQLQNVAAEAMATSKLKSEFVANVSHEIRTPLAGILGMAELLATRQESDAESREIAGYVLQSAQNLLDIVNDLLDFSKLEAGKLRLHKESCSIKAIINDVATSISMSAAKKGLIINVDFDEKIPALVFGDRGRMIQVMLNFAHNAVKFTEKGEITLSATAGNMTPDTVRVRLAVKDTGIGIKPEIQKGLFEPFVQGDGSTTRRYGGTGLGLSIAKKLTQLMGGDIGMKSELGSGSEFWVTVPLEYNSD